MNSRRSFIRKSFSVSGALAVSSITAAANSVAEALAGLNALSTNYVQDDELWERMAQAFTVSPNILNLNNGGVSPQPKVVQDAVDRYYHLSNEAPSYYMWQILDKGREVIRRKLSELGGVMAEEVAINRNTTEGLGTIASGLSLNKGDEIVMTRMDYPNMLQMWKQKEMREGVKINWVNIDLPEAKDEQIIQAFIQATTSRTKVWHITHMINWTGQILPVKQLCEEASKRNILSIVDAAHTFAQLDFTIADLKPDYLATSLHKWLCAPFGSGMLYVKKDRIEPLWPLFPNDNPKSGDIKKFEVLGTRSFATEQAIGQAIEFHRAIGGKRKQERLHYLKTYWADKISSHSRVRLHTPLNKESSCALACFSIEGIEPDAIVSKLFNEHQILTVPIKIEGVKGVRVTPHIYTTTRDLDRFVAAVMKIASL